MARRSARIGAIVGLAVLGATFGSMVNQRLTVDTVSNILASTWGVVMGTALMVAKVRYGVPITIMEVALSVVAGGVAAAGMVSALAGMTTGMFMGRTAVLTGWAAMVAYAGVRWTNGNVRRILHLPPPASMPT